MKFGELSTTTSTFESPFTLKLKKASNKSKKNLQSNQENKKPDPTKGIITIEAKASPLKTRLYKDVAAEIKKGSGYTILVKKEKKLEKQSNKVLDFGRKLRGDKPLFPEPSTKKRRPNSMVEMDIESNPFISVPCKRTSIFDGITEQKFEALNSRFNGKQGNKQKHSPRKRVERVLVVETPVVVRVKSKNDDMVAESPM